MAFRQPFKSYRREPQQVVLEQTSSTLSILTEQLETVKLIDPALDPQPAIQWGLDWNESLIRALQVDSAYGSDFLSSRIRNLGVSASQFYREVFVERVSFKLNQVLQSALSPLTIEDYEDLRQSIVNYRLASKASENLATPQETSAIFQVWKKASDTLEERKTLITS
jgi:hypothetical protein